MRRFYEATREDSDDMKRKYARQPKMEKKLTSKDYVIRQRYGYDSANYELKLEKEAIGSHPLVRPLWENFSISFDEKLLPVPMVFFGKTFYPGGNYDPYGANFATCWNKNQLTHVYSQLGALVDHFIRGLDGEQELIYPYIDRYSLRIDYTNSQKPSIEIIYNTVSLLQNPPPSRGSNKQDVTLTDLLIQDEESMVNRFLDLELNFPDSEWRSYIVQGELPVSKRDYITSRIYADLTKVEDSESRDTMNEQRRYIINSAGQFLISQVARRLRLLIRCLMIIPHGVRLYSPGLLDKIHFLMAFDALTTVINDIKTVHYETHQQIPSRQQPMAGFIKYYKNLISLGNKLSKMGAKRIKRFKGWGGSRLPFYHKDNLDVDLE